MKNGTSFVPFPAKKEEPVIAFFAYFLQQYVRNRAAIPLLVSFSRPSWPLSDVQNGHGAGI
jgi:hypothetical protein